MALNGESGLRSMLDHGHPQPAQPAAKTAAAERAPASPTSPLSATIRRAAADPNSLTRADVAQLQRTIGNAAVRRLATRAAPNENRTGLPDRLKAGIENLSGLSMDDVRVHYNSAQPARLRALAYTQGSDIHVAPGQEQHLPHEAWHVVQQKQGRVQPTRRMKGAVANNDPVLEREADNMGTVAGRQEVAPSQLEPAIGGGAPCRVIQKMNGGGLWVPPAMPVQPGTSGIETAMGLSVNYAELTVLNGHQYWSSNNFPPLNLEFYMTFADAQRYVWSYIVHLKWGAQRVWWSDPPYAMSLKDWHQNSFENPTQQYHRRFWDWALSEARKMMAFDAVAALLREFKTNMVTVAMVRALIAQNRTGDLASLYLDRSLPLQYWEPDAWSEFLDWNSR